MAFLLSFFSGCLKLIFSSLRNELNTKDYVPQKLHGIFILILTGKRHSKSRSLILDSFRSDSFDNYNY